MPRRLATFLIIAAFLGTSASSCILHTHGHRRQAVRSKKAKKTKKCPPSHYWNGKRCKHKGKGKGARKHDY